MHKSRKKKVSAQHGILTIANVFAGAVDLVEQLEQGADPIEAMLKSWKKGKRRAKAIAKADNKVLVKEENQELQRACPCGSQIVFLYCHGRALRNENENE
jgi:hypothetical protein